VCLTSDMTTSPRLILRLITAIAVTIGLTLGVGAGAAHAKDDVTLILTELPGQVRLIPGEAVELVQDTNLTTGFTWTTQVRGNRSAIRVGKGEYTAPDTDLVGAPGITTWKITARSPGRAVVRVLATPPGGGDPIVSRLTVIVMAKP
jgi:predicted secreted protein